MQNVYFTTLKNDFAHGLAAQFENHGYQVVTEPCPDIAFFIDTDFPEVPEEDRQVGEGINAEAAAAAYRKVVCEPLAKLETVLPYMTSPRRICFTNDVRASVNWSAETRGYGRNMAKAALNQILVLSKNGLIEKGYTFRLFDPLLQTLSAEQAAGSAYAYFTHDRFDDGPDNKFRQDERNLVVRDALGREIPW